MGSDSAVGPSRLCEFENLAVHFGGVSALSGATGEIYEDEVVAIVGPNGAGKTTFLNVVSGFVVPTAGRLEFMGESLLDRSAHERSALGIARSFQTPSLLEEGTALDNLVCGAHTRLPYEPHSQLTRRRRTSAAESSVYQAAHQLLVDFALSQYANAVVSLLPFGIRKLVDVLRAVIQDPALLLLDEPTAGMTGAERGRVQEIIARVRARSIAVAVVEHHMGVVESVADRVLEFRTGLVAGSGPLASYVESAGRPSQPRIDGDQAVSEDRDSDPPSGASSLRS